MAADPRLRENLQALRRRGGGATRSISRSPRARRSASSGRTAPARPRCSASPAARCAPDAGRVILAGADITRLAPERRCRMGIGRSFQIPQPFNGMTVFENLVVAAAFGGGRREREVYPRCVELLGQCGLADKANRPAGSLTLLDRKRLELARALATQPRVLLLDEVAGGLTEHECRGAGRADPGHPPRRRVDHLDRARRACADRRRRPARRAARRRLHRRGRSQDA